MTVDLLSDAAVFTLALLALFEGVRRVASRQTTRATIALVVVGLLGCALRIGLSFVMANAAGDVAEAHGRLTVSELRPDWGADLSPADREKNSRAYAATAFKDKGLRLEYFTQAGERKRFEPTDNEMRERDFSVSLFQQIEDSALHSRNQAIWLTVCTIVVTIAGIALGMKGRITGLPGREF